MTLRINGSDHGKDSDSKQQAEKHNLCSLVTEQANAGSRQIQRGGAGEHSHRAKKDRRRLGPNVHVARPPFRERGNPNMGDPSLVTLSCAAARTSHQRAAYATEPIWIERERAGAGRTKISTEAGPRYLPAKKNGERRDVLIHHATVLF